LAHKLVEKKKAAGKNGAVVVSTTMVQEGNAFKRNGCHGTSHGEQQDWQD